MANPVTHLEKTIAGEVQPVTHLEKVIAEYGGGDVYEQLEAGTNILIEETSDGKAKISASGEVSSEDTVARAAIAAIKDGTNIDSFGDVETALATKANSADVYSKTAVDTALSSKQDTISDLSTIRSGAALGATAVQPETGKGLSTNDYTNAEKTKLAGIEAQANKTTVDDALSGSSTNPVQNKVVKSALDSKADASTTYTKTEVDTALSGKQNAIDSSHKLSADLVDDTSTTNKFATAEELEQIQTNKNNISLLDSKVGVKNILGITLSELKAVNSGTWTGRAIVINGVTFTYNIDGTITADGTAGSGGANLYLYRHRNVADYDYVGATLTGCPSGGGTETYAIFIEQESSPYGTFAADTGSGVTIADKANHDSYGMITVKGTVSNITFSPMITHSSDLTFEAYSPTNRELYNDILTLQS